MFNKLLIFLLLSLLGTNSIRAMAYESSDCIYYDNVTLEDFEFNPPELQSWLNWDTEPDSCVITDDFGYNGTFRSLHLTGNTAKLLSFNSIKMKKNDVWRVAAYIESTGDTIGVGFRDTFHALYYSIAGDATLDIEEWTTVYQGINSEDEWHEYHFPVGDDWLARFGYTPNITGIVFINNTNSSGDVYFDEIGNMTPLLPNQPSAAIHYEILNTRVNRDGTRDVSAHFYANVVDTDSDTLSYFWQMGDSTIVTEPEFEYTYTITDDHLYSVSLTVTDEIGLEGYASCQIEVDAGASSLPLTLNFTGDVILARSIGSYINANGYEGLFDPVMDMLGNAADLTIANLECPLTDSNTHHPTKYIYFKGQMEHAPALSYAGIDIVTLANNHILDYMEEGITDTKSALAEQGILYSGAGLNSYEAYRPVMINRKGINLAFLAFSDRTGQYNNYQPYLNAGFEKAGFAYLTNYYVQKAIAEVRDAADLVIAEMHCGSEYSIEPSGYYDNIPDEMYMDLNPEDEDYFWGLDIPQAWDIEYRHFAVDAGADLVICHHPHIVHGFEVYNGKLIAHSLGNFIFDLSYTETMPTCILNAEIGADGFERFYITPCYIDDDITLPATGEMGLYILDHIAQKSQELNGYLWVDRINERAEIILDTLSMPVYSHGFIEEAELEFRDDYYTTGPIRLHKAGSFATLSSIDTGTNWQFRVGREIIYHGNFEDEGCSEWNVNSSHEWIEEEIVYRGSRSLGMECAYNAGDNYITNLEGRIKVYDDSEYSLHGMIHTINAGVSEVQIRTYQNRTDGDYINMYGTPSLVGENGWTYVWADLPVLVEGENFIDYRTTIYPPDVGSGNAYFDDVGLIGWTEWHDFNGIPVELPSPNEYYYIEMRTTDAVDEIGWTYTEKSYGFMPILDDFTSHSDLQCAVLNNNYPNPFNPETHISFTLNTPASDARINIYNIRGQLVKKLPVDVSRGNGLYSVTWQGTNEADRQVSSGVYFYRLLVDDKRITEKKCIMLK
ncbi:MAG: CapA family protein [Candidatus Cloacimonetes bacterium]|nr:CapA family protein [Candidatus Cloacimonadota bacterium]